MHHEYNEHHDLVHTWDSDGRETLYTYDQEHNPVRTMEKIKEGKWKETARKYDFRGRLTGTASVSFIRTEVWSGDSMMRMAT